MSRWGAVAVAVVAAGAWLSTPLWACPPEETPSAIGVAKAKKKDPGSTTVYVQPAPRTRAVPAPDPATTFEAYMLDRARAGEAPAAPGMLGDQHMQERLNALESRLNHLTAMLEALMIERGASPRSGMNPLGSTNPAPPSPPGAPMAPAAPSAPLARTLMPGATGFATAQAVPGVPGESVAREYRLPEGKLEALTELMARSDVPVLIERRDGAILVHGTEAQHAAFRAFLELIHPSAVEPSARRAYEEALAQLGRRPGQNAGAPAQREAIRAWAETLRRQVQEQVGQSRELKRQAEQQRREADRVRRKADSASGPERESLEMTVNELLALADSLEMQADEVEVNADVLESHAEAELEAMEAALEAEEDAIEAAAEELERAAEEAAEAAEQAAAAPGAAR
jgi:hypothetical protein